MLDPARTKIRDAASLGNAIRERRVALGMLQSDVAMQSGVSVQTVSAIENGKDTARIGIVLQICRDLGLPLTAGG
ncbi:helix-turn-helix transcriptional regulator [Cochlodiniinecator piscidefendens]|uniref:helix-turn-helix transcriptional regulator n=1 Tax=Cochlodiniinecator piscidefendens TaxID=2715756 RepID=UPI0014088D05|nr:helix-turn-helix domain-containing protein [Cochlodiniinecator piscidefendens]